MSETISIKHSYNAGDLILSLAAVKNIYEETGKKVKIYQRLNLPAFYYDGAIHPVLHDGYNVCQNQQTFDMLNPLIEHQAYVKSFEIWQGEEVLIDLDVSRDRKSIPMPFGDIHYWSSFVYPQLSGGLEGCWIKTDGAKWDSNLYREKIIINITERYRNPYIDYFFLKDYQEEVIFAGTEKEHKLFCEMYKLDIPLLVVTDFLELATYIENCKLFIGNQSLCWHLADAMKVKRVLEFCPQFPNTYPTGSNGYIFAYQEGLKYYFNKLIK